MGYGYGFPMFNYYNVLPYYIGAVLSFFVGFIWSVKILFIFSLVASGITMFIFIRELFEQKAAFVSAVLYTFAPYKALDIYVSS